MDLTLDRLLNLSDVTVELCVEQENHVELQLRFLQETSECPYCQKKSETVHQVRPAEIRDLSVFGKTILLKLPRRQFYCSDCQKYFNERLSFVELRRRYTKRYESYVYERVKVSTIEQVSQEEGLSWDQVKGIFDHQFSQKKRNGRKRSD